MNKFAKILLSIFLLAVLLRISLIYGDDVSMTKHNLSATWYGTGSDPRRVKSSETEMCVFCHTPHAGNTMGPLWNRNFSSKTYTLYQPMINIMTGSNITGSLDSTIGQPDGYSKLCLSCHDGSIAIGNIKNAPHSGAGGQISMQGAYPGGPLGPADSMPIGGNSKFVGSGELTGSTRRLGANLTNDHPISFQMSDTVVSNDDELCNPNTEYDAKGNNCSSKPDVPFVNITAWRRHDGVKLYPQKFSASNLSNLAYVQCTSCHNPHLPDAKFLREPIYDTLPINDPLGNPQSNQICYTCHTKPGWLNSTHEISQLSYRSDLPISEGPGSIVAQHGCLNCHDPHTIQGADRLHRNGASSAGGTPAIENTCFQCHISTGDTVPNTAITGSYVDADVTTGAGPPDIMTQFAKDEETGAWLIPGAPGGSAMPLSANWTDASEIPSNWPDYIQNETNGIHQPAFVSSTTGAALPPGQKKEPTLNMPSTLQNIHIECVDCHNPHQVTRDNRMRGMKGIRIDGVEIGGDSGTQPLQPVPGTSYNDDRDIGGTGGGPSTDPDTGRYEPLIYEICFRCHGDSFAFNMPFWARGADIGAAAEDAARRRDRGHIDTTTQLGASNKRREFNPSTGSSLRPDTTAVLGYNASYHPVAAPGRNGTQALCRQLRVAFGGAAGVCDTLTGARDFLLSITIQCTDCHNNEDADIGGVQGPITGLPDGSSYKRSTDRASNINEAIFPTANNDPSKPQGPHGSTNKRILRARYDATTSTAHTHPPFSSIQTRFALCFKCHEFDWFIGNNGSGGTNFGGSGQGTSQSWNSNLHYYHLMGTGAVCHECHNNVHSNAEANNTIYGDGTGGALAGDSHDNIPDGKVDTHLINFGPQATGASGNPYPKWAWNSTYGRFRCTLQCHGQTMTLCYYNHGSAGTGWPGQSSRWCAM